MNLGFVQAAVPLLWAFSALGAQSDFCEPVGEIKLELAKISAETSSFEQFEAPFRGLRDRYPDNLFVHIRYQDAVNERGVEGHLRQLHDEYLSLRDNHPDNLMYQYLYARVLMGRNTHEAIAALEGLVASHPEYAPARRTLAEIYGSEAFGNRQKERAERAKFEQLCPGLAIERRPAPIPAKSSLWARAESLVKLRHSDKGVPDLVYQALQHDEWRLQRIRPYDWYTPEFKAQARQELQLENWRGWRILVQHYWKTAQADQADQLLSQMQDRLDRLQREPTSEVYWTGAITLLKLYSQSGQVAKIRNVMAMLKGSLRTNPNAKRAAQLSQLRAKYLPRG